MKVRTSLIKSFISDNNRYLEEDGKKISKSVFGDVYIYKKNGFTFVNLHWIENQIQCEATLTKDQIMELKPNFGTKAVLKKSNQVIKTYDNFTVVYNRETTELCIYDIAGSLIKTVKGTWFEELSLGVSYKDSLGNRHMILLNGKHIEELQMDSNAPGFVNPRAFTLSSVKAWDNDSLEEEVKYLKEIIKNDLRNWDKFDKKYVAKDNNAVCSEEVAFDENRAIDNAKDVLRILREHVNAIKKEIDEQKLRQVQKEEAREKIDSCCENIDGEDFGL